MIDASRAKPLPVASPCIDVCELDADARRCLGCKRAIEEIAAWPALSHQERLRIMAELAARP